MSSGSARETDQVGETRALPEALQGIAPRIGTTWEWEPLAAHARCTVVVHDVQWNGEECWVQSAVVGSDRLVWNSLDRWVEATVFVSAPEQSEGRCPNEPHASGLVYDATKDIAVCPLCGHEQYEEMGG